MAFDPRQTLLLAILVLFIGKYLSNEVRLLKKFNIPEPVSGGLVVSILLSIIYFAFELEVTFSMQQRDSLLIVFFTCVGLSSRISTLIQGGTTLLILLALAVVYLFVQNLTGVGVALMTGLDPVVGVLGGSVSLSGGHGTAIAWTEIFEQKYHINNAAEIGIACATFGLVLGGIAGGPVARYLINKYQLKSSSVEEISVGVENESKMNISVDSMLSAIFVICITIGIGTHLHELLVALEVRVPIFVPCLLSGIILTNTIPMVFKKIQWPTGTPTLALVSELSLGLFLSMSLMSLQLWALIDLAAPIFMLLLAQLVIISLFVIFVVFNCLGRNYEAAIMSSGYAGLALGATPTAIANMTAVTKQYGAAPQAFIVVPLVGAFFIDVSNAVVIETLLGWFGKG